MITIKGIEKDTQIYVADQENNQILNAHVYSDTIWVPVKESVLVRVRKYGYVPIEKKFKWKGKNIEYRVKYKNSIIIPEEGKPLDTFFKRIRWIFLGLN